MANKWFLGREVTGRVSKDPGANENPAREQDHEMTGNAKADRGARHIIDSNDPDMRRTGA
jgi:hypothetical protein